VSRPRLSRFLPSVVLLLGAALAGCSSLPPLPERTASTAMTGTADTGLGALAAASLEQAGPGESGFRLLPTGDFALDARLALARRAERSLDAQYYQLAKDSIGLQFLRELRNAARRGVRVRLLVDDLYTGNEDELLASFATIPNVEVRLFNPLPSRGGSVLSRIIASAHEFSRINLRMHNKLFIADNRFSVSGGRNMADEYFMRSSEANFIDMDVIAAGPIVRELSQVFDRYWNSALAYPMVPVVQSLAPSIAAAATEQRFDELVLAAPPEFLPANTDPLGRASVDFEFTAGRIAMEFAVAAVLADTPNKGALRNPGDTLSTVNRSVLEELATAHDELLIASPYFIPGKVGLERLHEVIDRKVRIRVVTNGIGATDEPLVHWRYARYRLKMLKMGIELYEVSPTLARDVGAFGIFGLTFRRLHAKVAVFDNQRLFVGSMNFDPRSAWSNTESGLLIESPPLAYQVHNLLADEHNAGIYRLRLAADGETIQWWSRGPDGNMHFTIEEPDVTWTLQMQQMLLEPLVAEELL
jgi:putative cardiolipin synthase